MPSLDLADNSKSFCVEILLTLRCSLIFYYKSWALRNVEIRWFVKKTPQRSLIKKHVQKSKSFHLWVKFWSFFTNAQLFGDWIIFNLLSKPDKDYLKPWQKRLCFCGALSCFMFFCFRNQSTKWRKEDSQFNFFIILLDCQIRCFHDWLTFSFNNK